MNAEATPVAGDPPSDMADHVLESIDGVAQLRASMDREVETHQLGMERFTRRLGRPLVVYGSLAFVLAWVVVNGTLQVRTGHAFDPFPFPALQGLVSLSAFAMTILILTTTTRLGEVADRRARLTLQIGILTEQKVAKTIEMLDLLRQDHPHIEDRHDPIALQMSEPVDPARVNEALDESHRTHVGE